MSHKSNILKPYISEHGFTSSNNDERGIEIGYNLRDYDTRYQKNFIAAQPIKIL